MIKKLLGIAPQPTEDGAFSPSILALKLATSAKTNYKKVDFAVKNSDTHLKVMMICTEDRHMKMANGTYFSTGNHPVEMLLPMLHLQSAGFDIDVFTPSGKSAKIEMWAFPEKDEAVNTIFNIFRNKFETPKSLSDFVNNEMENNTSYVGVFIPGGHGAMLGLPENKDLGKLIRWSESKNLTMMSICHGPAALLAASDSSDSTKFIYSGYKIAAFPDSVDKQTPLIGYMPGPIPWIFGKKLTQLGVTIINKKADDSCFIDRNLITGASPKAANEFGILCAKELLKKIKTK